MCIDGRRCVLSAAGEGQTASGTWRTLALTAEARGTCRPHHVPLLRRRLRGAGDAGRQGRGGHRGRSGHPANFGRLCSKGSALGETLGLETRLLHPMVDGGATSWDEALDHVAARLAAIRDEHGPEAIAFYLSGQLLTEDYYVANKLAKGFIGTPHVDTNSRLCMASSVAGHRRAFGADVVPQCYEDLELADLVVLAGSNAAWCHPILYQRIQAARAERGVRVVNIDPRRTATSEGADLQLSIRPGTDGVLWSGLLVALAERRLIDATLIAAHTQGFEAALRRARAIAPTLAAVARATGLDMQDVRAVLRLVRRHAARRHLLQPGRQPVGAGHRQGQRDHQLPPGHGPHRQARLRPALAHRPAQRHGRARGRRARQHAGGAHGLLGRGARPRAPLLARAQPRRPAPASRPSTCSMPSPTAASRRCG